METRGIKILLWVALATFALNSCSREFRLAPGAAIMFMVAEMRKEKRGRRSRCFGTSRFRPRRRRRFEKGITS